MRDFSKPYGDVAHFGVWASETAADHGSAAALEVLTAAVRRCRDEDMREDRETMDALAWLTGQGHDKRRAVQKDPRSCRPHAEAAGDR